MKRTSACPSLAPLQSYVFTFCVLPRGIIDYSEGNLFDFDKDFVSQVHVMEYTDISAGSSTSCTGAGKSLLFLPVYNISFT